MDENSNTLEDVISHLKKNKSNIEIEIRLKQGLVEISQDKPVPSLGDAILISRKDIEEKNLKIKEQGDIKINGMKDIKVTKFNVSKSANDKEKKELQIKDLELKTKEVQMLRVKKEMQIALTKTTKDYQLNEVKIY